jgi:hypothetical protein
MMMKLIWISMMFLVIIGALFFASFGVNIPVFYREKTEVMHPIFNHQNDPIHNN